MYKSVYWTLFVFSLWTSCVKVEEFSFSDSNVFYSLAANGDLEGLEIWQLAGADLTMTSYDGQTPIEVVS